MASLNSTNVGTCLFSGKKLHLQTTTDANCTLCNKTVVKLLLTIVVDYNCLLHAVYTIANGNALDILRTFGIK